MDRATEEGVWFPGLCGGRRQKARDEQIPGARPQLGTLCLSAGLFADTQPLPCLCDASIRHG